MGRLIKSATRDRDGLVWLKCGHGGSHPCFGSVDWLRRQGQGPTANHYCCEHECCSTVDWKLEDMEKSVELANQTILNHKTVIRQLMEELRNARAKVPTPHRGRNVQP